MKRSLFRLLVLIAILSATFYLAVKRPNWGSLFGSTEQWSKTSNDVLSKINELPLPPEIKGILATASAVPKTNLKIPTAEEVKNATQDLAQNLTQSLPSQISQSLPKIQEFITNTRSEELYFKAPKSIGFTVSTTSPATGTADSCNCSTIPTAATTGQQIVLQLPPFEVKDTRKSNDTWLVKISLKSITNKKVTLDQSNVQLNLNKPDIEAVEGKAAELTVLEGNQLKVWSTAGAGKGHFKFSPRITLKIPPGENYSGNYTSEVESNLE